MRAAVQPGKKGWWELPPPMLSNDDLAHFLVPLTWPQIKAIQPGRKANWWRAAIVGADDHGGLGLLTWIKREKAWVLTDKGRRRVERGRTLH